MNRWIAGIVLLVGVAALAAGVVWKHHESPQAKHERLVRQFLAVLPDSLDSEHRLEIQQLFYMFYLRADKGEVAKKDVAAITHELESHIRAGHITASNLVHFMAEVGYTTYKADKRFNLEDGSIDNPELNPKAAMIPLKFDSTQYDSAFWADFKKWKKEHPELVDSLTRQQKEMEKLRRDEMQKRAGQRR